MWRGGAGALIAGVFLALTASAFATPPVVTHAVKADTSPPLRKMHPLPATKGPSDERVHRKRSNPPFGGGPVLTADPVQQLAAPSAGAPETLTSWNGVPNVDGYYPPDTNGDVGLSDYVQWVNGSLEVWSKTGTVRYGPVTGNTIWSGFGGLCETTNEGDPVVIYDRIANRWILSQFAFGFKGPNPKPPYYQCFAVSTTSDPTGSYHRYAFRMNATTNYFPDYPKLGVWPDAYYMSTNNFSGNFFAGAGAYALDRAKMLAGDSSATMLSFGTSATYSGLLPATLNGANLPQAGTPGYFGAVDTSNSNGTGSTFQLWKLHADFATPGNSTFTGPVTTGVAPYTWSFCGQLFPTGCIEQPGTSMTVDPLADRLMYRLNYRRFGDHEALVVAHTVNVGSDRAGTRWYEIRSPGTTPTLYQQGTFAPNDGVSRWMGSVNMNGAGDIALGYSASDGTSTFPSVRYTGRLAGDPLGTMTVAEQSIVAGGGSQTGADRWGDYSTMSVDPTDDNTFWYTQEYYSSNSSTGWKTRIGSFTLSSAGDTTPPDTTIDSGPSGATNNASPSFTFSSSETGSTFECKLDGPGATPGSYGSCSSPKGYSGLADGAYTFSVRATDGSSNTDLSPATRSFTVDTAAPDTVIDTGPSDTTNDTSPTFTYHSTEASSTFQCKLDGPAPATGTFASCGTSSKSYTGLADGDYTFSVRATDPAANTDATPDAQAFTVRTYPATVEATSGLVSYWRLGEASGTTANDEQGLHDGTYTGGVTLGRPGAIAGDSDTAAGFAPGVYDYANLGDVSVGEGSGFSAEAWIRTTTAETNRYIVSEGSTTSTTPIWGIVHDASKVRAYYRNDAGAQASVPSTLTIDDGGWHHVVMTAQKGGTLALYVDGALQGTATMPSGPITLNTTSVGLLRRATLGVEYGGDVDDVSLYSTALAGATVQQHYADGT